MGKKLESNFTNMVLVLFIITLITSTGVASVHALTKDTIAATQQKKQTEAIAEVIPAQYNNVPMDDAKKVAIDNDTVIIYPATFDGKLVGTAVKTFSPNGFKGRIELIIGFTPDGEITNYKVLVANETAGLGSKMDKWFLKDGKGNVIGKTPDKNGLKVRKDGGDVDAITGSTITSRAFLDAINRSNRALNAKEEKPVDSHSGASAQAH